jgi:hypothetical protein
MTAGHDQHSGSHQLMSDMGGWPGVPGTRSDTSGLSDDFVATVGDFAQLGDGVVKVAAFGGAPQCRAVPWSAL